MDSGYWIFRRKQPISYIILIILIIVKWNRVIVRLIVFERPRLEGAGAACLVGNRSRLILFSFSLCLRSLLTSWICLWLSRVGFYSSRFRLISCLLLIGSLGWRFLRFHLISCFEFSWLVSQSLLGLSLIRGSWIPICVAIRVYLNDITCRSWSNRFTRCHSSIGKKHQSRYRNTGSTKVVLTNGITEDLFPVIITI
ncbi:Uncharacterised protein [Streptococcus pneumoniae]|nr:Uncharacterised protein [Streptococcus pneumoniae]